MNAKVKSILLSKTFWAAIVAAVVGIVYMILDGQASKEGIVAEVMSAVMVVLRLVTTEPVKVRAPKRATGILIAVLLGGLVAGGAGVVACSAAQVKAMKVASADALACLLNAGVKEGAIAIRQWGDGQIIDGEGLTQELVLRALPCLLGLGAATVDTYVTGSHYGGSAGERNAYTRHYSITVLPSRAK